MNIIGLNGSQQKVVCNLQGEPWILLSPPHVTAYAYLC